MFPVCFCLPLQEFSPENIRDLATPSMPHDLIAKMAQRLDPKLIAHAQIPKDNPTLVREHVEEEVQNESSKNASVAEVHTSAIISPKLFQQMFEMIKQINEKNSNCECVGFVPAKIVCKNS